MREGYYSSGEFAKLGQITKKTIRYYDEHNILKPSYVNESGARFYTEQDFVKLQQILMLKYLGFSLEDIKEMTIRWAESEYLEHSLQLQLQLVRDRMEQLELVEQAICATAEELAKHKTINWSRMLELTRLTGMEKSLKTQYQNASNISARIALHRDYATNPQGWFPWIYEQCEIKAGMRVLELGCGDGSFWLQNLNRLPKSIEITLSDVSEGMVREVRRSIGSVDTRFRFQVADGQQLDFADSSFDLVIANHVLFYFEDLDRALQETARVLKPGGVLVCSTYGEKHMQEISQLVTEFDERIRLAEENLYERFGKQNGAEILAAYFTAPEWREYEDALKVTEPEALISYVLSCHGNQNQYILNRYNEFQTFVKKKVARGFSITKEAGIFFAKK